MANPQGTQGGQGNIRDRAENTGANLGAAAGRKVGEAAERAQQTAISATQKAQETASNLGQRAQDVASNVAQRAQDFASTAAERTDEAISAAGNRMSSWGSQLRENAPREGIVGSAASGVADTLQSGGQYLQQHDLSDMASDLTRVVRNYPIASLCIAFGVGCFLGMASSRR